MFSAQNTDSREDAVSFSAEIADHIPALRSLAKHLTRNEESAADLTQETLAKAWAARRSFAAGTNFRAWLATIMRNQFHSEMRRAWRQMPWEEEIAALIPAPGDEQNSSVELEDAARAIASLSRRQREALILAGVGGLSYEAVGVAIKCGSTAVKSRVCRARRAVLSMLDGTERIRRSRASRDSVDDLLCELHRLTASRAVRPVLEHQAA